MSLVMRVDGERWRSHLRTVVERSPGIVPVAKGNGYGFGVGRLARRAEWLGVDTLAVGTYDELDEVVTRFPGDVVVLTPWRPFLPAAVAALSDDRVIHTIGRAPDLEAVRGRRIVIEVATSMRRHGFAPEELADALRSAAGSRVVAISVHLPLPGEANGAEFARLLGVIAPAARAHGVSQVWVSHLSDAQIQAAAVDGITVRSRIGTQLWLGDPGAITVEAAVLDVHPIKRGEEYGYRRRRARAAGTIVIVSGGTAHGIGLEAPAGSLSARDRAARVARGGLDAMGRVRSPFFIGDHHAMFAEPPHMQSSMLLLPQEVAAPTPGEVVRARVRHTATHFDTVEIF
ncbi:MAG: alanine racemase [Marmoricola sp.]